MRSGPCGVLPVRRGCIRRAVHTVAVEGVVHATVGFHLNENPPQGSRGRVLACDFENHVVGVRSELAHHPTELLVQSALRVQQCLFFLETKTTPKSTYRENTGPPNRAFTDQLGRMRVFEERAIVGLQHEVRTIQDGFCRGAQKQLVLLFFCCMSDRR